MKKKKYNLNFIKIFILIFFLLSLFIFLFTFYKSEILYQGASRLYYLTYYIISFFFLTISFLGFKTKNNLIKINLIIFILSIIFFSYTFEISLRIISHFKNKNLKNDEIKIFYTKYQNKKYDNRNKIEIYKDMKKENIKVTMNIPPAFYLLNELNDIYPLTSKSNSIMINCNENGYYQIINSDRYGFNNNDKIWDNETFDYVLLGDSFTQGACVNKPDDISSQLEKLSNQKVLNLGYGSNGPLSEYATMKEYLKNDKKFNKIIWIYFEGNDTAELLREIKNPILKKYIEDKNFSQNLINKQSKIDKISDDVITNLYDEYINNKNIIINIGYIKDFLKLSQLRLKLNYFLPNNVHFGVTRPEPNHIFEKIMLLTKEFSEENNASLYFVYLPEIKRYKESNYDNSNYYKIKKIINNLQIPFIDIHQNVFKKETDPLNFFPFRVKVHYTEEGYKKISNYIYNFTKKF